MPALPDGEQGIVIYSITANRNNSGPNALATSFQYTGVTPDSYVTFAAMGRHMRSVQLLFVILLVAHSGCRDTTPLRMSALEKSDIVETIAPADLVGEWEGFNVKRGAAMNEISLAFREEDKTLVGIFIENPRLEARRIYEINEITIDGDKVHFYLEKVKSSMSYLEEWGVIGNKRQDFYFTMSHDKQSLDVFRKAAGQKDYSYLAAVKKLP